MAQKKMLMRSDRSWRYRSCRTIKKLKDIQAVAQLRHGLANSAPTRTCLKHSQAAYMCSAGDSTAAATTDQRWPQNKATTCTGATSTLVWMLSNPAGSCVICTVTRVTCKIG